MYRVEFIKERYKAPVEGRLDWNGITWFFSLECMKRVTRHLSLSLLPQVLVTLIAGYLSELTSEQIIEEEVRVNFGFTFELGNGFVLIL